MFDTIRQRYLVSCVVWQANSPNPYDQQFY